MMTLRRRVMGQGLCPRHAAVIVGAEQAASFSGQRIEASKTVRAEEKGVWGGMQRDRNIPPTEGKIGCARRVGQREKAKQWKGERKERRYNTTQRGAL